MSDFLLPLNFQGQNIELKSRFREFGFTVKVEVEIEGTLVTFEPDEERNWRAVMGFEDLIAGKKIDSGLLKAIAESLTSITK